MERAIEFLLQHHATLDERMGQTQEQIAETNRIVQMQAVSQSELNQSLTTAITNLAESQRSLANAQRETEQKMGTLTEGLRSLTRTVERYIAARGNGNGGEG